MNRRIYKKQCKRAATLIRERVPEHEQPEIFAATGDETLDAPTNMERKDLDRCCGRVSRFFAPLKGTPIVGEWSGYYDREWSELGAADWFACWHYWNSDECEALIRALKGEG